MDSYTTGLFWTRLVNWHVDHERVFPWRSTTDPYHIFVAEFLLQQTNAELVLPAYCKFLSFFPDVDALADGALETVQSIIRPLGLTYRAERLKNCAQAIMAVNGGRIPDAKDKLLALPGVGPYIADAVLCYAFHQPAVPIDTNVIRVMSRFFGIRSQRTRPRTDRILAQNIAAVYPRPTSRRENLALLDFAALICTARAPRCESCPVASMCHFLRVVKL